MTEMRESGLPKERNRCAINEGFHLLRNKALLREAVISVGGNSRAGHVNERLFDQIVASKDLDCRLY